MTNLIKESDPFQKVAGTGVLGRMIGALKGYEVAGTSLATKLTRWWERVE